MIIAKALVQTGMGNDVLAIGTDSISKHTAPGSASESHAGGSQCNVTGDR